MNQPVALQNSKIDKNLFLIIQMSPIWEKIVTYHHYFRYCHERSTIVFRIPSAIKGAEFTDADWVYYMNLCRVS